VTARPLAQTWACRPFPEKLTGQRNRISIGRLRGWLVEGLHITTLSVRGKKSNKKINKYEQSSGDDVSCVNRYQKACL
jgi:hypothetical protein